MHFREQGLDALPARDLAALGAVEARVDRVATDRARDRGLLGAAVLLRAGDVAAGLLQVGRRDSGGGAAGRAVGGLRAVQAQLARLRTAASPVFVDGHDQLRELSVAAGGGGGLVRAAAG